MQKELFKLHYLPLLLILACFIYVLVRSFTVYMTKDECHTIFLFVPLTVHDITQCIPCETDNQLANTLLIKFLYSFLPKTLFVARIPNLLAFVLFGLFVYKTSRRLKPVNGFILSVLLLVNPFLLDYFSLAKGNGLAMGFQLASLYYFIFYCRAKAPGPLFLTILFSCLASLSDFSHLYYLIALILSLTLLVLFVNKNDRVKFTIISIIMIWPLLNLVRTPIKKLIAEGKFTYGGNNNFYSDTLTSLTHYTQYKQESDGITQIILPVFLLVVFAAFAWFAVKAGKKLFSEPATWLFILTLLSIMGTIANHFISGSLYPIAASSLVYYPLLTLLLCFSANNHSGVLKSIIPIPIAVVTLINFAVTFNFSKTALWPADLVTENQIEILKNEAEKKLLGR